MKKYKVLSDMDIKSVEVNAKVKSTFSYEEGTITKISPKLETIRIQWDGGHTTNDIACSKLSTVWYMGTN